MTVGYIIYSTHVRRMISDKPPAQQVNLVAVKRDLLSLGQSERLYLAANGSYATLEQLRHFDIMNSIPEGNRWGYLYVAVVDGAAHFRITAKPTGSSGAIMPTLSIDETMQISP